MNSVLLLLLLLLLLVVVLLLVLLLLLLLLYQILYFKTYRANSVTEIWMAELINLYSYEYIMNLNISLFHVNITCTLFNYLFTH